MDDIGALRQEITRLWHDIDPEIQISLAYAWEKRDKLVELKKKVNASEHEVLRILQNIPRLERDSNDYKVHVEDLEYLIHIMELNESWYARIRSDVEFILQELTKIKMAVKDRWILAPDIRSELEKRKRFISEVLKAYRDLIKEIAERTCQNTAD